MPAAHPPELRQAVIDDLPSGMSCRAIAERNGVSADWVSKLAKTVGHRWGAKHTAAAAAVNREYGAEHRALLRRMFQQRAQQLLDEFNEPYLAFSFGGRDNEYNEHRFDTPPIEARRQMIQAAATAVKEARALDEHDRTDEHLSDFDTWLAQISGQVEAAT